MVRSRVTAKWLRIVGTRFQRSGPWSGSRVSIAVAASVVCLVMLDVVAGRLTPLGHTLSSAKHIIVGCLADGQEWPLTDISSTNNARMLYLLHSVRFVHVGVPSGVYDVTMGIICPGTPIAKMPHLRYSTATGELRLGYEYAYAPSEFRTWLRDLRTQAPQKHFRVRYFQGVKVVDNADPPPPPLSAVEAQPLRWHRYSLLHGRNQESISNMMGFIHAEAYEAQYTVGSDPTIKDMVVRSTAPCWQWPASYVGKTLYYRFRWKYRDGTYGPWSEVVSAEVLP